MDDLRTFSKRWFCLRIHWFDHDFMRQGLSLSLSSMICCLVLHYNSNYGYNQKLLIFFLDAQVICALWRISLKNFCFKILQNITMILGSVEVTVKKSEKKNKWEGKQKTLTFISRLNNIIYLFHFSVDWKESRGKTGEKEINIRKLEDT